MGGGRGGSGYTKPLLEVGRFNFLRTCMVKGSEGGREAGARLGAEGAFGGLATRGGWGGKARPPICWSPTEVQPMACTLALCWVKFWADFRKGASSRVSQMCWCTSGFFCFSACLMVHLVVVVVVMLL